MREQVPSWACKGHRYYLRWLHGLSEDGRRIVDRSRAAVFTTTFCNQAHYVQDGLPLGHECYVLPPAMLRAERDGDYAAAGEALTAWTHRRTHRGLRPTR